MYKVTISPSEPAASISRDGRHLAATLYCPAREAWHDMDVPVCALADATYPTWAGCLLALTGGDRQAEAAIIAAAAPRINAAIFGALSRRHLAELVETLGHAAEAATLAEPVADDPGAAGRMAAELRTLADDAAHWQAASA